MLSWSALTVSRVVQWLISLYVEKVLALVRETKEKEANRQRIKNRVTLGPNPNWEEACALRESV